MERKYWLLKSEPSSWSWDAQMSAGKEGTAWTGVRNHLAKQHLKSMCMGDLGFFYHSNEGKEIVGIVEVMKEAYPDPTAEEGAPWVVVDVKAVKPFKKAVTLAEIRKTPGLEDMSLLRSARLSVQPVTAQEWQTLCRMGGV